VFVAQFIGTPPMNVLPPGALDESAHRIGVRPEHLSIVPEGPLGATVTLVELLGHETLVTASLDSGQTVVIRLGAHVQPPLPGDPLRLDVAESHRQRFDAESGQRIDAEVPA